MVDLLSISVGIAVASATISVVSTLLKLAAKKHLGSDQPKAQVSIDMPDVRKFHLEISADEASALTRRSPEKTTPSESTPGLA